MTDTPSEKNEQDSVDLPITIGEILDLLPHRYPMLMIDRIVEVTPHEAAVSIKNVTINEPIFQGHFPGHPIFPGIFVIEAMAQTATALVVHSMNIDASEKVVYFMGIDKARFRKPIFPGDQIRIEVEKDRARGKVWRFNGVAKVDGKVAAESTYTAIMVDRDKPTK
jgi:3-hydroxyacyl-[acyl-carrier-protein] dehydratase